MKLKTQLNLLVIISILGFVLISSIGYFFGSKNSELVNGFINEGEKIERIKNHTRFTQVNFQRQVQEWKNILIRGNDVEAFKKYLKEFQNKEKLVNSQLMQLKFQMQELNLKTTELDVLIKEHQELTVKYLAALESFKHDDKNSINVVDNLVRGIDRKTSKGLDDLTTYIETQATVQFEELRNKSQKENDQQNLLLILFSIVGLFLVVIISKIITSKIYKQLGCEPEYAKEIANSIANGYIHNIKINNKENNPDSLITSIEKMHNHLKNIVLEITSSSSIINQQSEYLLDSLDKISETTKFQVEQTKHSEDYIHHFNESISNVTENANTMNEKTKEANIFSLNGTESFKKVSLEIDNVNNSISITSNDVASLSEQVNSIEKVISVIKSVADKTNLLALNAAIEAARAGEAGRGFAVVADEVRKLSETTNTSLNEIAEVLKSIQQETKQSVSNIENNKLLIEKAKEEAKSASFDIVKITDTNKFVIESVDMVLKAIEEQKKSAKNIEENIQSIALNADNNFKSIKVINEISASLKNSAANLQSAISHYNK